MNDHPTLLAPVPIPREQENARRYARVLEIMAPDLATAQRHGLWFFQKSEPRSPRQMRAYLGENRRFPRRYELLPPEAVVYALRQQASKIKASIAVTERNNRIAAAYQIRPPQNGFGVAKFYGRGVHKEQDAKLVEAKERSLGIVEQRITAVLEEVRETIPSRYGACLAAAGRLCKHSETSNHSPEQNA